MVNRNLIREFDVSDEDWNVAIGDAAAGGHGLARAAATSAANQIVEGHVLRIDDDFVLVDVGYKSEGIIPRNEWEEGDELPGHRRDDPRPRRRPRRRHAAASKTIAA